VTVALSGDGGDEFFAGYNRYLLAGRIWPRLHRWPMVARRAVASMIVSVPPATWAGLARASRRWEGGRGHLGNKLHRFAHTVLPARNRGELYHLVRSHWPDPSEVVLGLAPGRRPAPMDEFADFGHVEAMSLLDQLTYLPDDVLAKVDRAAMAVGLETRAPLLDHRVVEFAWRTPLHQKLRGGTNKWLLRRLLELHAPRALVERPKQGFGMPLALWLRGSLRAWAEERLDPELLRRQGFFDAGAVQRRWREHMTGSRNWAEPLWSILMFQAWWDEHHGHAGRGASPAPVCL
jgi:asparagine synthase (glutamine-hydrolysing)